MRTINVRLREDLVTRLESTAVERGVSRNAVVASLIEAGLDEHPVVSLASGGGPVAEMLATASGGAVLAPRATAPPTCAHTKTFISGSTAVRTCSDCGARQGRNGGPWVTVAR